MNKLSTEKRAKILHLLVEGNSMRTISRVEDVAFNTVKKLLIEVGEAADLYQYKTLRNLPCTRLQVDEMWAFCGAKDKNIKDEEYQFGRGSVWTWAAICRDTKIVPCWMIGERTRRSALTFLYDLKDRMGDQRIQLFTDGFNGYQNTVEAVFGADVDYAVVDKKYERITEKAPERYVGAERRPVLGKPHMNEVTTSHIERLNLNVRMGNRRYTRKTNAFSKKVDNHRHSTTLYFMYYNFVRIHKTLRTTPAMAAGVTDRLWEVRDIIEMADTLDHSLISK